MLRTAAPLIGALDCIQMLRASLLTAFLTGTAIGIPLYVAPQITSQWLLVRCAVAMVCLSYIALLAIFVHGPMIWTGWRFVSEDGLYAPLLRLVAWLVGAGIMGVLFEAGGLLPPH